MKWDQVFSSFIALTTEKHCPFSSGGDYNLVALFCIVAVMFFRNKPSTLYA